ncbi:MAG: ACP S-malonyltransferase [Deferribacteres bacterium]|nr:ACP S-malonyltransferase [candidate division KSB1 bacterium]MCB9510674.1 ACP S-malonyltransferase [Deferribacteres bacterium]
MAGKTAFIFPGQGSQHIGMAKDLFDALPDAKAKFAIANDILGFDLAHLCFEGPEEELKQTNVTQPAIFVHSCIVLEHVLAGGKKADMVAGHSLGEYTALVAAGVLSFEDALQLVKVRGDAMQGAGLDKPGTMAAVIGLESDAVDEICRIASSAGIVQAANYNSPGQIVISGDHAGIKKAIEVAQEKGARKAMELVVGGAFHSPLMEGARQKLKLALDKTTFQDARVPIYQNATATAETDAEAIKNNLDLQLTNPVRWIECVEGMITGGASEMYELGPSKVLTGLVRRIDRSVTPTPLGTLDQLSS